MTELSLIIQASEGFTCRLIDIPEPRSTLHAKNANQALDRIINFFPDERKAQLLHDLGNNVRAIVSQ